MWKVETELRKYSIDFRLASQLSPLHNTHIGDAKIICSYGSGSPFLPSLNSFLSSSPLFKWGKILSLVPGRWQRPNTWQSSPQKLDVLMNFKTKSAIVCDPPPVQNIFTLKQFSWSNMFWYFCCKTRYLSIVTTLEMTSLLTNKSCLSLIVGSGKWRKYDNALRLDHVLRNKKFMWNTFCCCLWRWHRDSLSLA